VSESVVFVTGSKESGDTITIESVADILERELQCVKPSTSCVYLDIRGQFLT
jgi:hypothetical protein